ncbi:MAG TPA: DUF481 domain-containing protein, partial [Longimicrobiales bacterium]|nr:DUF481 domain-containing protein [Longimicrobiales bacterium]
LARPATAQDEPEPGWSFEGELSTVLTEGNSSAFTLGVGSTLTRVWENARWKLEGAGIQTESGTITRTAVGSAEDFEVVTDTERRTTAESYALKTRYDRDISDAAFAYGAADWRRNTFAGIESRVVLGLGAGRTFRNDDVARFQTGAGVTFTFENDVVRSGSRDHPGLRGNYEYWRQLTETTELDSELVADVNLDDADDVRLDWTNAVTVDISSVLALKPSLQLQWRNQPALTEVPLVSPGGEDTGTTVRTPLEKLDTQFRLALVLTL